MKAHVTHERLALIIVTISPNYSARDAEPRTQPSNGVCDAAAGHRFNRRQVIG